MANKQHRTQYQLASVMNLPFQNDIFDGVISASLINIVADQNKAIAEMLRVCKPGGLIAFLVPTMGFDEAQLDGLVGSTGISGFAAAGLRAWHKLAPKMHTEQAKSLFQQADLEPATINYHLQGMVFSLAARKR